MNGNNNNGNGNQGEMSSTQVQKFISGVNYPASKEDLITHARQEGADEDVLQMLEKLPDQTFDTPADVSKALGEMM